MPRLLLSDEHWSKLREILLDKAVYNKRDLRMTVEGMLYRMRTGCPWRDLPKAFGSWSKVYKRFNAWSASGKWLNVFQALVSEPDMDGFSWMAAMPRPTSTVRALPVTRMRQ
jgi:transposase